MKWSDLLVTRLLTERRYPGSFSFTSVTSRTTLISEHVCTTVDLLVAGSAGPNAARIMPKVHDMWVNSLAALLPPISV